MKQDQTTTFDYINFAYGIGAAVVIIAAMFKFVGWEYSNELFILGLTVEALVFIISAFEYKQISKNYKWENIFPELTQNHASPKMPISQMGEVNAASAESLVKTIESFEAAINRLNVSTESLTQSAEKVKGQVDRTEKSSMDYASEIEVLKSNLNTTSLAKSLESFDATIRALNAATENLAGTAKGIQVHLEKTENSSQDYSKQMSELKDNLNKMNAFYKDMLQVMGKKA